MLKYCENKKYGFFTENMTDVSSFIAQYNYIYEPNKPLKGISTYNMGELNEIASKIDELAKEPKMSKPDLYGKIWHNLLWV